MQTSHTLGPWSIHSNEYAQWISNSLGKAQIAKVFQPAGMKPEESQANAHLISAAPELLAALEDCLAQFTSILNEERFSVEYHKSVAESHKLAISAISKAKGQP